MGNCPARAVQQTRPVHLRPINNAAQAARARLHWRRAVRHIAPILRLRRRWAALGRHLQAQRIQDLVQGLDRRRGVLTIVQPAPFRR